MHWHHCARSCCCARPCGCSRSQCNTLLNFVWKRLDGAKLDGARDFLKKLPKSISEIWTVFKLINKLPKNYNFNTRCTAKRCNSYFDCNFRNCLMSLKTVQISLILFSNFSKKISDPSS